MSKPTSPPPKPKPAPRPTQADHENLADAAESTLGKGGKGGKK